MLSLCLPSKGLKWRTMMMSPSSRVDARRRKPSAMIGEKGSDGWFAATNKERGPTHQVVAPFLHPTSGLLLQRRVRMEFSCYRSSNIFFIWANVLPSLLAWSFRT